MKSVCFTQFLRPDGRPKPVHISCDDLVAPKVEQINALGLTLTAEVLMNGMCSFAVEHAKYGDFDNALILNGPGVRQAVTDMLLRFDVVEFNKWLNEQKEQEKEIND